MMYEVYFINFGYSADKQFDSLAEAEDYGVEKGFEFTVYHIKDDDNKKAVLAWGPIFGRRDFSKNQPRRIYKRG